MKKCLAAIIAVLCLIPMAALAIDFSSGNSFVLNNEQDLRDFATAVNNGNTFEGKTVKLGTSISLSGEWIPIGAGTRSGKSYTGHSFKGTFNGDGYIISGLTIASGSGSGDHAMGLFGVVDGGTVTNVVLNVNINTASECAGGAVGMLTGGGKVSDVTVNGSVTAGRGNGGIVGRMTVSGVISDCVNNAEINSTSTSSGNVGGIVGAAYYTEAGKTLTIQNCVNTGRISSAYCGAGGIVGLSAAEIDNCQNSGSVTGSNYSIGGIVGEQTMSGYVNGCTNSAAITSTGNAGAYGIGGIVGWIRYNKDAADYAKPQEVIAVTNNRNSGSIYGANDAGGIVGTVFSRAKVTGNVNVADKLTAANFAAGIVGNFQSPDDAFHHSNGVSLTVTGNVSTTPIDQINANCTNEFVYNNLSGNTDPAVQAGIVIKDNTSELPVPPPQPEPVPQPAAGGASNPPKTGDETPILLLACLLVISGSVLFGSRKCKA